MSSVSEKLLLLNTHEYYYYKHKLMIMNKLNIDESLLFTSDIIKQNIDLRTLYNASYARERTIIDKYSEKMAIHYDMYGPDKLLAIYDISILNEFNIYYSFSDEYVNYKRFANADYLMYYKIFGDLFSYNPINIMLLSKYSLYSPEDRKNLT